MNFTLTEEQTMLSDMVNRLFEHDRDTNARHQSLAGQSPAGASLWPMLSELGILGIQVPEAWGGMAQSAQDNAIASHLVAKAMGRSLATEPFISTAVVAASLLSELGSTAQKQALLPALIAGRLKGVLEMAPSALAH